MLMPLVLGSIVVVGNMVIQIIMMLFVIHLLLKRMPNLSTASGFGPPARALGGVVLVMFLGHLVQFAIWAALFVYIGEFKEFATAFYFSAVNFTSLGYGDIVMSAKWRLLGPLEAANGVLMLGLSAGAILAVMHRVLSHFFPGFDQSPDGPDGGS
ncbi:MAG TPA: ion channel [Xanthomonadales bacterium]|nr:ion channel [Xanthomonadales bacterium]